VETSRKRHVAVASAIFGGLALTAVVLAGALAVADKRAAETLNAEPRITHENIKRKSTASAARRGAAQLSKQHAASGGTSTVASARTDAATVGSADSAPTIRITDHHHRRRHHRR